MNPNASIFSSATKHTDALGSDVANIAVKKTTKRYSNVLPLCLFNKACIEARDKAAAEAQAATMQQQQLLLSISNQPVGGLTTGAILGIIAGLILIAGAVIYMVNRKKNSSIK